MMHATLVARNMIVQEMASIQIQHQKIPFFCSGGIKIVQSTTSIQITIKWQRRIMGTQSETYFGKKERRIQRTKE